jgi:SAM-dependent methyltransferase
VQPKPRGLDRRYADQFCDAAMVDAYAARAPYPAALDPLFVELCGGPEARVLDLGCGTGELARRLAPKVGAIVAVDQSAPMIARARTLPGGDAPNLHWIVGRVEEVALDGPFSSALAAESFHWFDWQALVPRLAGCVPSGRLILAERREAPSPWTADIARLLARFSTNRDFEPFDLIDELTRRRCLRVEGRLPLRPQPFVQPLDDYVTSFHSRNGFSRARMGAAEARAFDDAVRAVMAPHAAEDVVTLSIVTRVVWGSIAAAPH